MIRMIRSVYKSMGPLLLRHAHSCPRPLGPRYSGVRQLCSAIQVGKEGQQLVLYARDELSTQQIAALLARDLQPGDCYCLYGTVGAGKSVFRCILYCLDSGIC